MWYIKARFEAVNIITLPSFNKHWAENAKHLHKQTDKHKISPEKHTVENHFSDSLQNKHCADWNVSLRPGQSFSIIVVFHLKSCSHEIIWTVRGRDLSNIRTILSFSVSYLSSFPYGRKPLSSEDLDVKASELSELLPPQYMIQWWYQMANET